MSPHQPFAKEVLGAGRIPAVTPEGIKSADAPLVIHEKPSKKYGGQLWNCHIGGYQVCEKWLKDRKGRILTADDRNHYQKIVVALSETIRLMAEIDAAIEKHGGWPAAFTTPTPAGAQ